MRLNLDFVPDALRPTFNPKKHPEHRRKYLNANLPAQYISTGRSLRRKHHSATLIARSSMPDWAEQKTAIKARVARHEAVAHQAAVERQALRKELAMALNDIVIDIHGGR